MRWVSLAEGNRQRKTESLWQLMLLAGGGMQAAILKKRQKTVSLTAEAVGSPSMLTKGSLAPVPTGVTWMDLDGCLYIHSGFALGEEV